MTPPVRDGAESVTLHSSWRGLVSVSVGAAVLDLFAVTLLMARGFNIFTIAVLFAAAFGSAVVLFDMPVSSVFDRAGVVRRTPLRHHRLPWDRVNRLTRVRRGALRTSQSMPVAGLVAMVGKRRVMLVDRMESRKEFHDLVDVLGPQGQELLLDEVTVPPIEQQPTWMYRRSMWAPDGARRRSS